MENKEIERLAELISIKTSEKYLAVTKEFIDTQISLHAAQCEAKKFVSVKNFVSGILGGIVVGVIIWLIKS